MSNGWLNPHKYEHVPILSATGPGTMHSNYAWKWVNHSTEGPPGSIAGTISWFQARPASCPHFMIDPMGTGRRIQHIPWTWSACALKGGSGGYQTNRGRAVQMEICGYARDAMNWPDDALWTIADVIADVIADGCPINTYNVPDSTQLKGTLATARSPQRMTWPHWQHFDGIAAHVYVPNNDHWDVGQVRSLQIAQFVRDILAGQGRTIVPGAPPGQLPNPPSNPQAGYISKGMTGGGVKLIQELLTGLKYDVGPIDGVFGYQTEQGVMAFQRDNGLSVDGIAGPQTLAKLSELYAPVSGATPLPPASNPAAGHPAWPGRYFVVTDPMMQGGDIVTWQTQMAARGWRLAPDGWYGLESFSICKTFQHEKGLTVDGVVGPQTWSAAWTTPVI